MNVPKIQINLEKRELTEQEKRIMLINQMCVHLLIRTIDQLKATSVYRTKLKQVAGQLSTELEKHAKHVAWDVDLEDSDVDSSFDQMEQGARNVEYLMQMMIMLGRMHESQWPLFFADMNPVFKRHGMNLMVDHNGHMHAFDVPNVEMILS
jgi:hypothetical protein